MQKSIFATNFIFCSFKLGKQGNIDK